MSNRGGLTINMHNPTTSVLTELSDDTLVLYIHDEDSNGLSLFIDKNNPEQLEFVKKLASYSMKSCSLLTRVPDTESDTDEDEENE